MPRLRKPVAVLDARGAFKKNPQRRRYEPEVREPLGPPPESFDADHVAAWQEVCHHAPIGVLKIADRVAVETLVKLIVASRRENIEDISSAKLTLMVTLLGRLGMTPVDRAKLAVPQPATVNPFEQFAR